eukprot:12405207-Karenia_brevis.AAC.1
MCPELVMFHLHPSLLAVMGSNVGVAMVESCLSVSSVVAKFSISVFVTGVGRIDGKCAMQSGNLQKMSNSATGIRINHDSW